MTAEPLPTTSCASWPVPPPGGYTVDDLFSLPDLPPHTELLDGSLVFVSPQRDFHALTIDLLVGELRQAAPEQLRVRREMSVVLDSHTAPEPDLSVVRAEAITGLRQTRYEAKDIVLAVEVVSPDSESRDRDTKPRKYAQAGIPHFWRVEMAGEDDLPAVFVYEYDPTTRAYVITGVHHNRLKVPVPFEIDIDLTRIAHL